MIRSSLTEEEYLLNISDLVKLQAFRRRAITVLPNSPLAALGEEDMARTQALIEKLNEQLAMQRDEITQIVHGFTPEPQEPSTASAPQPKPHGS